MILDKDLHEYMVKCHLSFWQKTNLKSLREIPPYHVVFDFLQDVVIGHNQFFCCCSICYIGKYT